MQQTLQLLHEIVWGPWTMLLFLGTGLFFTVKSGGFQIRKLPYWWKKTMGSLGNGSVSSFQTSCTALAATIGTGNIVGVATALTVGGPVPCSGSGFQPSSAWPRLIRRPAWDRSTVTEVRMARGSAALWCLWSGGWLPKHGTALCAVCGTGFFGDGKHGAGECGK